MHIIIERQTLGDVMNRFYKVALLFVTIHMSGCSSINNFLSTEGVVSDPSSNRLISDSPNSGEKVSDKSQFVATEKQSVDNIPANASHAKDRKSVV